MKPRQKKRLQPLNPATVLLVKQCLRGLAVFLVVGLILTGVWHFTRAETFTITTLTVSGNETITEAEITGAVSAVLSGTYLGLVPRQFSWFYPKDEATLAVSSIPRIKTAVLSRPSAEELMITVTEYQPDALWCSTNEAVNCLFLDETGYAFAKAPNLAGGSLLRYVTLQREPETGVRPFIDSDYQVAKEFATGLASSGWFVSKIEIDVVRDAFFTLVPSSEIKLTLVDGAAAPLKYVETLRGSEEFAHLTPGNFQYLDLRFGAKVFVNETLPTLATTTPTSTEEIIETVTLE